MNTELAIVITELLAVVNADVASNVLRTVLIAAAVYLVLGLVFAWMDERSKW